MPILAGFIGYAFSYPLGAYNCYSYGKAKGIDTKYQWFSCYVKDGNTWLEKSEYLASEIGMKLILAPQLK